MSEDPGTIHLRTVIPGERIYDAWQKNDPRFTRDAISLWQRPDLIPDNVMPEDRAKELVCIAYVNEVVAGLATAELGQYQPLKRRFAFMRIYVEDDFRLHYLQLRLSAFTNDILKQWSMDHPRAGLSGIASVRQGEHQRERKTAPVSPRNQSVLVGYNSQGHQIRIRWFDHVRV